MGQRRRFACSHEETSVRWTWGRRLVSPQVQLAHKREIKVAARFILTEQGKTEKISGRSCVEPARPSLERSVVVVVRLGTRCSRSFTRFM